MASNELQILARRLIALEDAALGMKQPSLGYSSFDGGAIQANDQAGDLQMVIGQQFDGTTTAAVVSGPTPPQPSAPYVMADVGGVRIFWDGQFDDAAFAPMDFARVIAYAIPLASFESTDPLDIDTMIGQFVSATGGELTAALDGGVEYLIFLVCWSQAGKFGEPSTAVTVTPLVGASAAEIAGKSSIYRSVEPPWEDGATDHDDDIGDVWYDITPSPGPVVSIDSWAVTSGVATVTTSGPHGVAVGRTVAIVDTSTLIDGSYVVTAATDTSVSFDVALPDSATAAPDGPGALQGLDVAPANIPNVWDGSAWVMVRDSGIDDAASLVNGVAVQVSLTAEELARAQQELGNLAVTANDAYLQAYAADGRVSISDYEPTANDVEGKNDGSLWITRTRNRTNEAINPSFEVSVTGWSTSGASIARVAASPAAGGGYAGSVVNSSDLVAHEALLGVPLPVAEGEKISVSGYLRSETGLLNGYTALVRFLDAGMSLIEEVESAPVNLLTTDYVRPWAAAVAPAGSAFMTSGFAAPTEATNAVWHIDGVLVERSPGLGRYFDGDSEGGTWAGTPGNSAAKLDGNAIVRLFTLEDGAWAERKWTADTIGSVNASTIDRGAMNGGFLADNTVAVDKLYTPDAAAGEALTAGMLVNVFDAGGTALVRPAAADDVTREAHGFVLDSAEVGEQVRVYTTGYNPLLSGLTAGPQFLSVGDGTVASAPPQGVGRIVQRVGFAIDSTTLDFAPLPSVALT